MHEILKSLGLEDENSGAWAGGRELPGRGRKIDSFNPATGERIASIRTASPDEYEEIIGSAKEAFHFWRAIPAPQRGEAVRLCAEALRRHKDALGSLVSLEMGKIKAEGDGEVQEMIDIADFAVGQSRMLYGRTMHSERPGHRMYEQWHPLGVVGVISAFNFPVAVWSWNAFIAAVCGDVCIWKPSPKTPLCALAVQKICNEALAGHGYPPIFNVFVEDDVKMAEAFVDDPRVDLVSFTGSTPVGRKVGERVAARMGRSLLELGGNNAIIVDEKANLELAVPAIVFGAVGTAGQRCTTTRRVLVHEKIFDELTHRLMHAYEQVKVGDPLDAGTLMGPLIDGDAVLRYEAAIEKVIVRGGRVLCGGHVIAGKGHFVQPTIVKASNEWDVVQEETFAPILYLIPYHHFDEAIALNNGVRQGLSSAIFTDDLQAAERFLSATGSDCGIANINIGTSGAEIGGAFGGEKETGGGREAGSDAWKAYMRRQTNTINFSHELPLAQGIKFDLD